MGGIGHNSRISQSIFRSNPDSEYTKLANSFLRDGRLSLEARGLLAELLSRPDDWEITVAAMVSSGVAGRDKIYRIMREAEKLGYAIANQGRRMDGSFQKQQYIVTDDPRILIEIAARELLDLEEDNSPLPENTEAVVLPFPEKAEAANAKNGWNQAASWKAVNGSPVTGNPLTGQPLTANPTHTKERYIQTKETTKPLARENDMGIGKVAAAMAASLATAVLPAAAAPHHPVEHVMHDVAECWQTPKTRMMAGLNINELRAQRQVWMTANGLLEATGEFRAELEREYPAVSVKLGLTAAATNVNPEHGALTAMKTIRRQFAYMQTDAEGKQKRADAYKKPEGWIL